jgi:A/G-specific adenine glycosylase
MSKARSLLSPRSILHHGGGSGYAAGAAALHNEDYARALLAWYDRERRILPWRTAPGVVPDPYGVWLSEIMLQQTTVQAVLPRFADFLRSWPDVSALASADLGEVLAAWAGLGYYARARNLHACAQEVVARHGGRFPETEAELRTLPGIGDYTAAAIAAIAFDARATPIDGNIERVVARLFAVVTPLPAAKPEIRALAMGLTPPERAGDFAQAMMDLGATLCRSKRPACRLCPLVPGCAAHAECLAEVLPYRDAKPVRPVRRGHAFVALREDGSVLLRERPPKGLLGGMLETPSSPWVEGSWRGLDLDHAPLKARWREVPGLVGHTFTHFHLELAVYLAEVTSAGKLTQATPPERCHWVHVRDLHRAALPSVMRKVLAHALDAKAQARAAAAPPRARRQSA